MGANGIGGIGRRDVLKASAAVAAFAVIPARAVRGTGSNEKVKLGLIGSGNRGTWIADLFGRHGGYEISAVADYFEDRVNAAGDRFKVPQQRRFTGLACYKRLLDEGVDAVAIESPPFFHPVQAQAAVDAGAHVYCAKPVAVDVPGCNTIAGSGEKASANRQVFLVDFQTRADQYYIEAIKRVHAGALGRFAFGESWYHAGCPWQGQFKWLADGARNPENRLRAWGLDKVLSGDIITEQNIHTLDVASWIMDAEPVRAWGTCDRKVRTDGGNCNDYFAVTFQYPDNVAVSFTSRQFEGHGTAGGINNRMFGAEGVLETSYGGNCLIRGRNFYRGGRSPGIYQEGAQANIAAFHRNIIEGDYSNETVAPSVRSNMVTILGRTAAYTNEITGWKDVISDTNRLEADLSGLKV